MIEDSQIILKEQILYYTNKFISKGFEINSFATKAQLLTSRLDQFLKELDTNLENFTKLNKDSLLANFLYNTNNLVFYINKNSYKYFLLQNIIIEAISSKIVYTSLSNLFLLFFLELQKENTLLKKKQIAVNNKTKNTSWTINKTGLARYQGKAYILLNNIVQKKIIKICYNNLLIGYFGYKKILVFAKYKYY